MNVVRLRSTAMRALIATAALVLLSGSAAYAQEWKTQGKYQVKGMSPGYSNPQSTKYDPGNNVVYLDNQRRAQFKLEFKTGPDGKRRAYLPNGAPLDTRVNGNLERAIFVMDAAGSIYVIVNGSLEGKIHHSTVPGGEPVAAAGQIKAVDGVIVYVDNQSGHYEPENKLLMQLIQALEELGILKGTYEVNFETHDPVPPNILALDPNGQEKLRKGEIFISEPTDNVEPNRTTRATGSGKETGGREVSATEAYSDVPESFYRVGMLRWNNTPDNDVPDGVMKRTGNRQEFNLFPAIEGARFFARRRYRGNDRVIYELRKQDLVKTAEGREFLERVQKSIDQNKAEIAKLRNEGNIEAANKLKAQIEELAIYLTSEESFNDTVLKNARSIENVDSSQPELYNEDIIPDFDSRRPERPPLEPIEREVAPGPVEPDLEAKIENFLRPLDLQKMASDRDSGNFEIFKNQLFAREPGDAGDKVARTWKKVCSKLEFSAQSKLLAEMRWKMLVNVFAEIARSRGIKIQLIDSGKRNAYRSDIDLTVFSPVDGRGGHSIESLMREAEAQIKLATGGRDAQSFDITMHNGDLFAPNIRNSEQSVEEYSSQLREVAGKLRLKVQSNGDASYFPGAQIEDAQKRGMRDAVVTELSPEEIEVTRRAPDGTPLESRLKKPEPKEFRAAEIGPNGEIIAKTDRFAGEPHSYDRNNALSALAQNFEKVFRNGDKPGDFAKLFNRGLNLGAGAGEVNSFLDIHVSDLPDNISPEEAARLAIETDRALAEFAESAKDPNAKSVREAKLKQLNDLRSKGLNKAVTKMRWIMRSFRYTANGQDQAALTKKLLSLYDLLNTCAAIEIDKGKGNFDWNKDRARYLERYIEKLKREMPEMAGTPKGVEILNDEAYRAFCDDVVMTLEEALVTLEVEALRDLTPDRIERFRQKGGGPAQGEGVRLEQIAKKLAEQRRTELALLVDVISTYVNKSRFDSEYKDVAKDQAKRLEKLRERILKAVNDVDPDIAKEAVKLMREFAAMKEESLGEFTANGKPPSTTEEVIAAKVEAAKRLAEIGPEAANSQVKDQTLREYIKDELRKVYNPADGPLLQQMFDALEHGLGDSITQAPYRDPKTGEVVTPLAGGELAKQLKASLTAPLMVGSSVVSMGRAYVTGGERALKEAAIGEAFNFLPPAYGIIGIAFKDFSRGHVEEGARSLGWLAGIHFGDQVAEHFGLPFGLGSALLVYNIVTGVPEIVYTYTSEKINSDIVEQALRSQRAPGKRAQRNPYKDSTDFFNGDTPEFPIFWDNPCMKDPDDNLTIEQRAEQVSVLYAGQIARDLQYWGLRPEEVRAIEKAREPQKPGASNKPYENPNLIRFSPKWYEERYRLLRKYAFDHPYYQRMGKIYECFYPRVKDLKDKGFDEDLVLKSVFGKEVDKWFSMQPDGYRMEFSLDVGRQTDRGEETRKRLLGSITNQVIAEYHKNEYETNRKIESAQAARAVQEKVEQMKSAIKQMIATQKIGGDRLQQKLENRIMASLRESPKEVAAQVQVKAPIWYVNMSGVFKTQTNYALDKGQLVAGAEGRVSDGTAKPDGGTIPIDVAVRIDRSKYSAEGALKHDFKVTLATPVEKAKPAGFIPNAEESKLLAEVGSDGNPKNDIYTINLVATATVYGSQGEVIGQSRPAPIVGYVIAEVPRFKGQIAVRVRAPFTNSRGQADEAKIDYEARIDKDVKRGRTSNDVRTAEDAKFDSLKAQTYQVTVTPLSPDFGPGTGTFTLNDVYTKAAYDSNNQTKNPDTVEVILPYKGLDAANKPQGPVHKSGPGGDQSDDGKGALKSGGKKTGPDDPSIATQKAAQAQACQQLASQAQQSITAGNLASAAKLLQQAKQNGCEGLDPRVDQALAGAQGAVDNNIAQKADEARQLSAQCEYEQALALARDLMRISPGNPALAGINMGQLQALAEAQHSARAFLQVGKAATERGDLDGAISALQRAMAVPNLPDCMRQPIASLLGELNGRKTFGNLTPQVDGALAKCDTREAVRLIGLVTNIQPRTEIMKAWLDENILKVADRQNAEREANRLLQMAREKAKDIRVPMDRQLVFTWVAIAKQKVAPCELKLDPILMPFNDPSALDPPTDEVPGALGSGKGKEAPTDELPGALGSGKGKQTPTNELPGVLGSGKGKQTPTDDVPGVLGSGKGKQTPTDDVPGVLGSGKGKQTPSDEVPGAIGSTGSRPPGIDETSNPSGGNGQEKPQNPNKPGKSERIGKVLGAIGGAIATAIDQSRNRGNTGGSTNGGRSDGGGSDKSTGDGASGKDVDLSGTWAAEDKDHNYLMVLKRFSASEWQGTWKITSKANPREDAADTRSVRLVVLGPDRGQLILPFYTYDVTSFNASQIVADRTWRK